MRIPWETVSVGDRIPILTRMHERSLAADRRIEEVQASIRCPEQPG
jgi:hypothetical protein